MVYVLLFTLHFRLYCIMCRFITSWLFL